MTLNNGVGAEECYDQSRKVSLNAIHIMRVTLYILITQGSSWELRNKYVN